MNKKILYLLIIALISCTVNKKSKFVGKWEIPSDKSAGVFSIIEKGENYWIDTEKGKFIGILKNDTLVIKGEGVDVIGFFNSNGVLILNGKRAKTIK